jgi:hypothetical protein
MQTFDQDLTDKVQSGVVEEKVGHAYAINPQDFKLMLQGSLVTRQAAGEASLSFMQPEDDEAS